MSLGIIGGSTFNPVSGPRASVRFDTAAGTPTYNEGTLYWDATDKTVAMQTEINGVTLQIGQEQFVRVLNKTGSTITDGTVVYINGAQSQRTTIAKAIATSALSDKVIGLVTYDIADNAEGYVTVNGLVRNQNTNSWNDGDELYVSATTAGALTNVRPDAPNHAVRIGVVTYKHPTNGVIYVSVNAGEALAELHDVKITSVATGDSLRWDGALGYWKNVASGVWTDGSYANPSWVTSLAGSKLTGGYTVSGLTMATAKLLGRSTASTGAAEEITVGAGLTLSGGTLSSSAAVSSVGASGADGITVSGSPITTSGVLAFSLSDNGIQNAKLATMAANTIKGNNTGATANQKDLTATEVATMLPLTSTSAKGMCPQLPSSGGTGVYLRGDGSWQAVAGSGTVTSVDVSGGSTGLTFSGGPITASGTVTMAGTLAIANGGTGAGTAAAARTALGAAGLADANTFIQAQRVTAGTPFEVYSSVPGTNFVRWMGSGQPFAGDSTDNLLLKGYYGITFGQGNGGDSIMARLTSSGLGIGVIPSGMYKLEVAGATFCTGWSYTGNGSASTSHLINGNNSGAGGGSRLRFQAGSADVAQIGMLSAITGGAYDATTYIASGTGLALKLGAAYGYAVTINTSQQVFTTAEFGVGTNPTNTFNVFKSGADCVASFRRDSDADFRIIAGTSYATIGTGGAHDVRIMAANTVCITLDQSTSNTIFGGAIKVASKTADPTGSNGMIYYDSANSRLRAYVNGLWKTVTVS